VPRSRKKVWAPVSVKTSSVRDWGPVTNRLSLWPSSAFCPGIGVGHAKTQNCERHRGFDSVQCRSLNNRSGSAASSLTPGRSTNRKKHRGKSTRSGAHPLQSGGAKSTLRQTPSWVCACPAGPLKSWSCAPHPVAARRPNARPQGLRSSEHTPTGKFRFVARVACRLTASNPSVALSIRSPPPSLSTTPASRSSAEPGATVPLRRRPIVPA
jgi:hypothetical protein